MAEQEIKTSIDALMAYLNEHGESNSTVVSSALGVSENVVLGWANVLEKAKLIKILHKSGRVFLAPLGAKTAIAEGGSRQEEKSSAVMEIESQVEIVKQVSARIEDLNKSLASVDSVFDTKYRNAKKMLDKLNSVEGAVDKAEKKIAGRGSKVKDISDKVESGMEGMQKYMDQLESFSVDTNNASAISQELHALLKTYEKNEADMSKSLEAVIYQYRRNALDISRTIREKHDQLRQVLEYEDRQIRQYEHVATDYKRSTDALIRHAESIEKDVMDEVEKGNADLDRLAQAATVQVAGVKSIVDEMKKDLGGISELNAQLQGLKKDLADVTAMRDSLLSELKGIQQEIKESREDWLSSGIKKRAAGAASAATELKGKIGKVESGFKELGDRK